MKYINYNKLEQINLNKDNFYVLIDFDRTITKGNSFSSWKVLYYSNLLGDNFRYQYDKIHDETAINNSKSYEERFTRYMELLEECKLNEEILRKSVEKTDLQLRDGAKEFFDKMYKIGVPVIIISSGIKNVVQEYLKFNNCFHNNIHIYSNFFDMSENRRHIYNVTPYNKNQISFSDDLKKSINKRKYILLLRGYCRRCRNVFKKKDKRYYNNRFFR